MNLERWNKLKVTLADAIAVDPARRAGFLEDSGLEADDIVEIESLLRNEVEARDFLSIPASGFAADFFPTNENGSDLRVIGAYEIVDELGAGGMGAVFLGERRDGKFAQRVAIKMIRREFNTEAIRKNFDREKNILAALSHSNIAGLLDAGTTDDGVPYLAMEYVEGVRVDSFCYENNLDLKARLKLFNKICEAVAFAHRHLIVHRDIKPSNILVTADGTPKLLDFGISKILDAEPADSSTTLHSAMTPEYASPEQINGQPVTTATDVYSLGVVLYKMLTGAHPFKQPGQSNNELYKAITGEEPTAPSLVERKHGSSGSSEIDHSPPSFAASQLKGDVDNIVLKAIRKDPEIRYQSVEQLSADIWRFMDGKPVEARPATPAYRLSRFYLRNRFAVTASVLVFVTLIAGVAVSLWQARVARANAVAAAIESDNAKAEQAKAEKLSRFLMRIVSYASPNWYSEGYRFGGEARVIDALDDMAGKIDAEFADQPDVLAELHHNFGDAYFARSEPGTREKARSHFERAYELRVSYHGNWHELVAKDMAYLYWVQVPPRSEQSIQLLSDAIVMMRATNPKNLNLPYMLEDYYHRLSDDTKQELSDLYLRHVPQPAPNDKYMAANQLFDEMLGLLRFHFAEDTEQILLQKCSGATLKFHAGRMSESEEFYQACKQAVVKYPDLLPRLEGYRKVSGRTD